MASTSVTLKPRWNMICMDTGAGKVTSWPVASGAANLPAEFNGPRLIELTHTPADQMEIQVQVVLGQPALVTTPTTCQLIFNIQARGH